MTSPRYRLFGCIATLVSLASGAIVSDRVRLDGHGELRVYFDDSEGLPHDIPNHIMLLGVGAAMSVDDYNLISAEIITSNPTFAVALLDPNPGFFVKSDFARFARCAETAMKKLPALLPSAFHDAPIIVGGHSNGGEGAIGALSLLSFQPVGLIGLDPYQVKSPTNITVPAMLWGFTKQTCLVPVSGAAQAAYLIGDASHRVLYQIQNTANSLTHCSFTDNGCPSSILSPFSFTCPTSGNVDAVRKVVGQSVQKFVKAIVEGTFERSHLTLDNHAIAVTMFVNEDQLETPVNVGIDTFVRTRALS